MKCPRCGSTIYPPATSCDCGTAKTAPAPAATPDAPPPNRMIPKKNKPALIGYYLGLASLVPYVAFLAIPAIVLGVLGLRKASLVGEGRGHAVTAIVLAAVSIVVWTGQWQGWWHLPIQTPFGG